MVSKGLNLEKLLVPKKCSKVAHVNMVTFRDQMCATSHDASQME